MRSLSSLAGAVMLIFFVLASGCQNGATTGGAAVIAHDAPQIFDGATLESASRLVGGFDTDAPGAQATWTEGDTVVLGLVIERRGERTTRLLKIEAGDPSLARMSYSIRLSVPARGGAVEIHPLFMPTSIVLYDEKGETLSESSGEFSNLCVGRGVYLQADDVLQREKAGLPMPVPSEELEAMSDGQFKELLYRSLWAVSLGQSMGKNPALSQLLRGMIEQPSLLSYLFGVDVSVSSAENVRTAEPVVLAGHSFPSVHSDLRLSINDTRALSATIRAVPAVAPLYLCGGVTEIDACGPTDPERRVLIRLLGARRGTRR